MTAFIVEPALTMEMVVRVFQRLGFAEFRKRIDIHSEMNDGHQNGYMMCLNDFFGEPDDAILDQMFDEERTVFHIIDRIMEELHDLTAKFNGATFEVFCENFDEIDQTIKNKVIDYVAQHPDETFDAVKNC